MVVSGVNLSFGLFLAPLSAEFGGGRGSVSLAATVNLLLFGLTQPLFGRLIDTHGPRRVMVTGLGLMAFGTLGSALATRLWQVDLCYGLFTGAGATAAGVLTISVLVLRWFSENRATALTLISTGSSLGQALFYQLAAVLIVTLGWRTTYAIFAALLLALIPACLRLVRDSPPALSPAAARPHGAGPATFRAALKGPAFSLLAGAYLACGFTDFMITTHLPALAMDIGLTPGVGARALSVLALGNVAGLLLAGRLADRIGNRLTLGAVYLVRALALTSLAFVGGRSSLYGFAFVFGLTFFTTAPLTSALVSDLYGLALTGRVFGALGAIHHLAGALGAWLAGAVFDWRGSYLPVFLLGAMLVYAATTLIWWTPSAAPARETSSSPDRSVSG